MAVVLVVDDDDTVREVVVSYLRAHGHRVVEAGDGEEALAAFERAESARPAEGRVDLVVLDLMLPGVDGWEVMARLRRRRDVPVVLLSALGEEGHRVAGLEGGADDYVSKPFSPRELALRVDTVLRRFGDRGAADPAARIVDGDLVLDRRARSVELGGAPLALTGREFDLLDHFVRHPGAAFDRDTLLRDVWGWSVGDHSTVTVHVRRLREKVERDPTRPERLLTVWGVGYRWVAAEPAQPASDGTAGGVR